MIRESLLRRDSRYARYVMCNEIKKRKPMTFKIEKAIEILERTPLTIETLLKGISEEWLKSNEGENTWSPYGIVGHLIHGEKTDWITRARIILSGSENKTFIPFDRYAQKNENQETPIEELLEEFKERRSESLKELKSLQIDNSKLEEKGIHPELGEVNLKELLSTWVVHDLSLIHISEPTRPY